MESRIATALRRLRCWCSHPLALFALLFTLYQYTLPFTELRRGHFLEFYGASLSTERHAAASGTPYALLGEASTPSTAAIPASQAYIGALASLYVHWFGMCVWRPLIYLYFRGPAYYGYGFWNGKNPIDICAQLTNLSSQHLHRHPLECADLLFHQLDAFLVATHFSLLLVMLYSGFSYLYYRYMVYDPLWRSLQEYLRLAEAFQRKERAMPHAAKDCS